MKLILISTLLFVTSFGFAQNKVLSVSFLKNDGSYVDIKDSADYFRAVTEPDSGSNLYNITEVYKDGKKKLIGKSLAAYPQRYEGQVVSFYKNGVKESITTYKNGMQVGAKYEFYTNGKTYRVTEFPDNNDPFNELNNNYLIEANYDSLGTPSVENGNGYYKGYNRNFNAIDEEGPIKNGKKDSLWRGTFNKGKCTFNETYKDGALVSGTATFEDGGNATYTKLREVPPQFKGGVEAFYQYLGANIRYPGEARLNKVEGRVVLTFVVERDGKVTDVVVKTSVSPDIDAEASRVISNCPNWIPGRQFGRNVRVSYSVPVSFTLGN